MGIEGRSEEIPSANSIIKSTNKKILFFVDWDDTLLASNYLKSKGYSLDNNIQITEEDIKKFDTLGEAIINLLEYMLKFGDVHIVSNSEHGWIRLSSTKFMPNVLQYLENKLWYRKIMIHSVRRAGKSPKELIELKTDNFTRIYHGYCYYLDDSKLEHPDISIVSLGDSTTDRKAVFNMLSINKQLCIKHVKLIEVPTIDTLISELKYIQDRLEYIINCKDRVDQELISDKQSISEKINTSQN